LLWEPKIYQSIWHQASLIDVSCFIAYNVVTQRTTFDCEVAKMRDIGVRELKTRASEIMRNVWKRRARYVITYRGRPIGLLTPLEQTPTARPAPVLESADAVWAELTRLGEEISRGWRSPQTSTELLSNMRR
jgi:prevent-host-death family protein